MQHELYETTIFMASNKYTIIPLLLYFLCGCYFPIKSNQARQAYNLGRLEVDIRKKLLHITYVLICFPKDHTTYSLFVIYFDNTLNIKGCFTPISLHT